MKLVTFTFKDKISLFLCPDIVDQFQIGGSNVWKSNFKVKIFEHLEILVLTVEGVKSGDDPAIKVHVSFFNHLSDF